MFKSFISFLTKNPFVNSLLLLTYYLLVVLPHEKLGVAIFNAFKNHSRDEYNMIIIVGFIVFSTTVLAFLAKEVLQSPAKNRILAYSILQFILISISFYYLIIVNIECIHFIQYAVFAILAYSLVEKYQDIILLTLIAAIFDEAYQYFYLSPQRTNYYDFNDIVLDLIGAGSGIIILYIYGFTNKVKKGLSLVSMMFFIFSLLVILAFTLQFLWVNPTDNSIDLLTLIRVPEEGFWTFLNFDVVYHVLKPWEGILLVTLLSFFYLSIDYKKTTTENH